AGRGAAADQAGSHPPAPGIDARRVPGNGDGGADSGDPAVADQDGGVLHLGTRDGIDRPARDRDGLGEQKGDHRSLPGGGVWPSWKSLRGWWAVTLLSYRSQPSL